MKPKNRSGCGCLPLFGGLLVLAVGGTVLYLHFRGNLPGQDFTPLKAATVIPESAFASSYVSTNPQDWSKLERFGTPEAKTLISQNLDSWQQRIQENQQIDLQNDVIPWLGGVTFAFLPSKTTLNGSDILLVVGIKDKLKAADFAKKLQNQSGYTSEETEYQGITITKTQTSNYQSFASAILGNYLVMGENPSVIEQAIDTFKGEPSYAQKEGIKQLLDQKMTLKDPLIRFYIDDYAQMVQQGNPSGIQSPNLQQLQSIESMIMGIGVENEGLHLQALANIAPDTRTPLLKPLRQPDLSQFPAETFLLMQGQGIQQGWDEMVAQSPNNPDLGNIIAQIRNNLGQANLDADKEVFGWLDGEFTLGLVNLSQGGAANLGLGGLIVLETSDRTTGEATLSKLNQMVQATSFVQVNQRNLSGIELTEWSVPQQGVILSHGWLNGKEMMLTLGTSYETIQNQSSQSNLSQNPQYNSLISALPSQSLGSFYLDMEQIMSKLGEFPPIPAENVPTEALVILNSIKGIGMTATLNQADVMITLKQEN